MKLSFGVQTIVSTIPAQGITVVRNGRERNIYVTDSNYIRKITTNEITCFGVNHLDSKVCNEHGSCIGNDECSCQTQYTGLQCDIPICFGVNGSATESVCSGFGKCTSPDHCQCPFQNSAKTCPQCFGATSMQCTGHGMCTFNDHCICNEGYVGSECQYALCSGTHSNDSNVCSGRGECLSPNICRCHDGYVGHDCEVVTCNNIPYNDANVCNNHGKCVDVNQCICDTGYSDIYCQTIVTVPVPYEEKANYLWLIAVIALFVMLSGTVITAAIITYIYMQRRRIRGYKASLKKEYSIELLSDEEAEHSNTLGDDHPFNKL